MASRKSLRSFALILAVFGLVVGIATFARESLSERKVANVYEPVLTVDNEALEFSDYDVLVEAESDVAFGHRNLKTSTKTSTKSTTTKSTTTKSPTTTTRVTFWDKLKNSLAETVIGLLLICFVPCFMWKNEGRHVKELKKIDFCKNEAIVVDDSDSPSEDDVGRLVYFTGAVSVGDAELELPEGGLNVTQGIAKALIVKRTCYIYQKFEESHTETEKDKIGGGETQTTTYSVREDWTTRGPEPEQLEHLEDETNSRGIWDGLVEASGNGSGENYGSIPPDSTPSPNAVAVSSAAHVGGFGLSEEIIREEPFVFGLVDGLFSDSEDGMTLPVPADLIPDSVEGCEGLEKGSDGILRTFPEDEEPKNGDCKVVYEFVQDGFDCTFIVQQTLGIDADPEAGAKYGVSDFHAMDSTCFGKCDNDLGQVRMIRRGKYELPEMIEMATSEENACHKLLRLILWALLVGGWTMLFSIFTTVLSTLPLIGTLGYAAVVIVALIVGTLCCGIVTSVAFIRYRPLLMSIILVVLAGITGIVVWRLNVAAETAEEEAVGNSTNVTNGTLYRF
uniref:Uncharacterized protein n=1 Tax=Pseudictyota dubia TaxID=2749911 RepID=A0A7R9WDD3_9STRA